jgi:DNA-binding SARP family transcriptional activator
MPLETLVKSPKKIIAEQFRAKRLLLIHPASRYHNLIVSALLSDPPCPVFYHSLNRDDLNLCLFLEGLANSISYQKPGFGMELRAELGARPDTCNVDAYSRALIADLSAILEEDYILVLDEFDRVSEAADVLAFLEELIPMLPAQCHILINGRRMPRIPWVTLVAKQEALVIGDQFMAQPPVYIKDGPNVEVQAFGAGTVMVNGEPVDWQGILPKLLLFYAVDRGSFTRDEVCESFWPQLPIDQAVNVFHVTKRRMHRILGFNLITHRKRRYQLSQKLNVSYDILSFVQVISTARRGRSSDEDHLWQQAISLYRGDYLQGHNEEWIVERRKAYQVSYVEALNGLAEARKVAGNMEGALGVYLQIAAEHPGHDDIHAEVLRLFGHLAKFADAERYYKHLQSRLQALPPKVEHLYQELMQHVH